MFSGRVKMTLVKRHAFTPCLRSWKSYVNFKHLIGSYAGGNTRVRERVPAMGVNMGEKSGGALEGLVGSRKLSQMKSYQLMG